LVAGTFFSFFPPQQCLFQGVSSHR
jgi:hypothetical protein